MQELWTIRFTILTSCSDINSGAFYVLPDLHKNVRYVPLIELGRMKELLPGMSSEKSYAAASSQVRSELFTIHDRG